MIACLTFDFNELIYNGEEFTKGSAWVVLILSTIVIAIASYALAEAVMLSAKALEVPPYFTAVIFGAAASSVPVRGPDFFLYAIFSKLLLGVFILPRAHSSCIGLQHRTR
eukprot:SAG11_NODE_1292_length_5285_cov_9.364057_5_plen_110_part_00